MELSEQLYFYRFVSCAVRVIYNLSTDNGMIQLKLLFKLLNLFIIKNNTTS